MGVDGLVSPHRVTPTDTPWKPIDPVTFGPRYTHGPDLVPSKFFGGHWQETSDSNARSAIAPEQ